MAIVIGVFASFLLSILLYLTTLITKLESPLNYRIDRFIQTVLIIALFFVVKRLLVAALWNPYEHLRGKAMPRLFIDLTEWLLLALCVISITVFVFEQPLASLMTFGGLVSAGIAFSLQSLILDLFSGIVLDIERPYEIKDWIKVPDHPEGMVVKIGSRTTTIVTNDNTTITLPHGKLAQGAFTNYSKPSSPHWDEVQITLDECVPLDRAERIMRSAILPLKEIHNHECYVWALSAGIGSVVYSVRYLIPEHTHWRAIRHIVLMAITKELHLYGLRLCEVIGGYSFQPGGLPLKLENSLNKDALIKSVDIFASLGEDILQKLTDIMPSHVYGEKDLIIKKDDAGDTMYIVAEGVAEVIIEYPPPIEPLNVLIKKEIGPYTLNEEEHIKSVKLLRAGTYFGEMALLLGQKRSATVRAKTEVILFVLSKEIMTPLLKENPEIALKMSDAIARRQIEMSHVLGKRAELEKQRELASTKILEGMRAFFDLSL
jgi:small-conductance mechanosensitive channel/CRP-like cAMP-binding protein